MPKKTVHPPKFSKDKSSVVYPSKPAKQFSRARLSPEEKIALIRRAKAGEPVARLCREAGISRTIFYRWLKKYRQAPRSRLHRALSSQKSRQHFYPRQVSPRLEKRIITIIRSDPRLSSRQISQCLPRNEEDQPLVGNHGVQNVLQRLNLNTVDKRVAFANKRTRLPATFRKQMLERVIKGKEPVSRICREYGISRTSFYRWLGRYQKSGQSLRVLSDRVPQVKHYWRQLTDGQVKVILDLVVEHPEYSSHKIAGMLSWVGNHGVQNALKRSSLNTLEKRLAYAQSQALVEQPVLAPRPVSLLRRLIGSIPAISSIPPPIRLGRIFDLAQGKPSRLITLILAPSKLFVKPFLASLIISLISNNLLAYWLSILAQTPGVSGKVGMVFATMALVIGGFFFTYSMKYYFTLALVLSFSRQTQEEGTSSPLSVKGGFSVGLNGQLSRDRETSSVKLRGWLARVFGIKDQEGLRGIQKDGKITPGVGLGLTSETTPGVGTSAGGLLPSLDHIELRQKPFVSIHLPFYNEKKVAQRIMTACANMDYYQDGVAKFEVLVCDDSTDETVQIVHNFAGKWNKKHPHGPRIKVLHRPTREGFKGAALGYALKRVDPRTDFISVFDADFVPYPDTLTLFAKYMKANGVLKDTIGNAKIKSQKSKLQFKNQNVSLINPKSKIAAVTGYQWHVLNKSENWITRGVRTEYAGSYVIERPGREILGLLKQIHGTVYMARRDVIEEVGWGTSITEDFQLTLKLYEAGYKIVYTPYVQAPAECVSTLKRLIRQRMRWAEGHSNNIRKMALRLLFGRWEAADVVNSQFPISNFQSRSNDSISNENSKTENSLKIKNRKLKIKRPDKVFIPSPLSLMEKLEVLYLAPYYLQAFFFLIGTFSWLISETVFQVKLPFWTELWGWSLVLTNLFSLPLMNAVGMFLEESEERDYLGIFSFMLLCYILVPFQAYASVKGLLKKDEGPWFRTPKTGKVTDVFTRGRFYRWVSGILPGGAGTPAVAKMAREHPGGGTGLMAGGHPRGGAKLPASPYLALATANNRFDQSKIKSRGRRWPYKAVLSLLLATTVTLFSFSYQVSEAKAYTVTNYYLASTSIDEDSFDVSTLYQTTEHWQKESSAVGSTDSTIGNATHYWYSREYPTGTIDATIAAGTYTFNGYKMGSTSGSQTVFQYTPTVGYCTGGCNEAGDYTTIATGNSVSWARSDSPGLYADPIGTGSLITFTAANPGRLYLSLYVSASSSSYGCGYNGSAANYISNLSTPTVTVPESWVIMLAIAPLLPMIINWLKNQTRASRVVVRNKKTQYQGN